MTPQPLTPRRVGLQERAGKRRAFIARYVRVGARKGGQRARATVLIADVRDAESGAKVADHLWFNRGRRWRTVRLRPGDRVAFSARPIEYRTGYWGPDRLRRLQEPPRIEFGLTPPEGLRVISREGALAGGTAGADEQAPDSHGAGTTNSPHASRRLK